MAFVSHLHPLKDGRFLAEAVLDSPATLNALTQEMLNDMSAAFAGWRVDDRIAAVFLRGGEKHFCAGGNILNLVDHIRQQNWRAVSNFFQTEYRLDIALHRFPKPLIGWATGAVMGGGMGVFQGCAVRLVTTKITMAMPEVSIGLFPDVGANWFLRRCPQNAGLFFGLTATPLNTSDALCAGLADYTLPDDCSPDEFIRRLCTADWRGSEVAEDNLAIIRDLAASLHRDVSADSVLNDTLAEIQACCGYASVAEIADTLRASPRPYLQEAAARLSAASPTATVFWHRYWTSSTATALEEVFAADYAAIMAFCRVPDGDFAEGVRALLIDKDKNPRWQFSHYNEVPPDFPPLHRDDAAIIL